MSPSPIALSAASSGTTLPADGFSTACTTESGVFIELHAQSAFSFLEAAEQPETLAEEAARLEMPALALVDRDGVYGAPRFYQAMTKLGLRAIVGSEIALQDGSRLPLLVEDREGYQNLCRLITKTKLHETPAGLDDIEEHAAGLVCLTGTADAHLDRLLGIFGRSNCFVEIQRHLDREQERRTQRLIALADRYRLSLVATNQPTYCRPGGRAVADVLTCIREHTDLDHAGRHLARNAERSLKAPRAMARLFADRPDVIANAGELATRLNFTLKNLGYRFPDYPLPPGETSISYLTALTERGARERYGRARELSLIGRLDLAGYFLIVWEIVQYCRTRGILVQGRGSAANSAVCYSLGITAVDPVGMELLFERFLSEARGEWPDIDLDLPSGDRREQVIQHVYQRYGTQNAGMTANVITYRGRLAAREVGKALGLPPDVRDRLSKLVSNWGYQDPNDLLIRHLDEAGCDSRHPRIRQFARLWCMVQDLPRHLGQHSGGMVISGGRLDEVVPLEPATMPGRVVIQWDKDDCAALGIVKVDLLGLGMMAVLQDAITLVREQGGEFDLAKLPPDDPAVYAALQKADTVGLFQVESRAQMATLPRIHPERFYDLAVQVAIIRPGPIVGHMVHPYINRRRGREPVTYPHPSLEPILKRTLGVPLFQEQLLRLAMVAAGFSGSEAEELRRAFGFKRSESRMQEVEAKLRAGMAQNGITGAAAEEIVRSITSFALYGFPEAHASSFALLAYASAWLRTHYPAAFYAAILNNQPMGFYHPATLVKDAQRHGLRILPIDVTVSDWLCTIESIVDPSRLAGTAGPAAAVSPTVLAPASARRSDHDTAPANACDRSAVRSARWGAPPAASPAGSHASQSLTLDRAIGSYRDDRPGTTHGVAVRLGLRYVRGLRESAGRAIVAERSLRSFRDLDDLVRRCQLAKDEVETLAEIGALAAFGLTRRAALWEGARAIRPAGALFEAGGAPPDVAGAPSPLKEMTHEERLVADYGGTGITIGPHPMAFRRAELSRLGVLRAIDLSAVSHGRYVRVTAKGFVFLSLEDETGIANVIVRPRLFERCRLTLVSEPFLLIEGTLQQQDNVVSVRAERVEPLPFLPCHVPSHDFG
ncbi:MAG: error-prone DNA polymerase [Candidatus Rokuibacteriota bacterium]|nr:MAG: error-prone DNA polymerase [Candidatus Rokubacteria bacterium]